MLVRKIDLRRVVGRRLTEKLIRAGWITPVHSEEQRGVVFDAQKVHRALGRLCREGYLLLPRAIFLPPEPKAARKNVPSLEADLARLLLE